MEEVLFNRYGKSVYRLCDSSFYDFQGKPRGFLVGKAIYDLRGQHRGYFDQCVMIDRMGRILGFAEDAHSNGFKFPPVEIPPLPYKNLPAPEPPADAVDRPVPARIPAWSMMPLENVLV